MPCKKRKKEVISESNNAFSFSNLKVVIIKNRKGEIKMIMIKRLSLIFIAIVMILSLTKYGFCGYW